MLAAVCGGSCVPGVHLGGVPTDVLSSYLQIRTLRLMGKNLPEASQVDSRIGFRTILSKPLWREGGRRKALGAGEVV